MTRTVYVGTATHQGGKEREEGIYVYRMDAESGKLEALHAVNSGHNPSFLALHPEKRFMYCVNESMDGAVSAFAVDAQDGSLTLVNRRQVGGDLPCYVTVDPSGRFLLIANYWSGSISVFPISADGGLSERCQLVRHTGSASDPQRRLASHDSTRGLLAEVTLPDSGAQVPAAVNSERQETAHAHSVVFAPGGKLVLSADLGMDRVWVYRFSEGHLTPNRGAPGTETSCGANLNPGAGPRHLAFHPNGRFLYVSTELASSAAVFAWDETTGSLTPLQEVSLLPADYNGRNDAAHIALTPDGRFLYASNRGHNSLAIFSVDGQSGQLTAAGHVSTLGSWPRHFCIDPDGRFLLAANQESASVAVFAIDAQTGALQPTGEVISVPAPFFVMAVDL